MNKQEQQTMRETIARRLGYTQESEAWWTHPDGTRTSNDGLPRLDELVNMLIAKLDVADKPCTRQHVTFTERIVPPFVIDLDEA